MDTIAQVLNEIFDEIFLEWGARNSIVLRSRRELGTSGWRQILLVAPIAFPGLVNTLR